MFKNIHELIYSNVNKDIEFKGCYIIIKFFIIIKTSIDFLCLLQLIVSCQIKLVIVHTSPSNPTGFSQVDIPVTAL